MDDPVKVSKQNALDKKIEELSPEDINPSNCTPVTSFNERIIRNAKLTKDRQNLQFNLGNSQQFSDPIQAAEYLLKREYKETFLFQQQRHNAIIIPPVFLSKHYNGKSSVAVLDYNIVGSLKRLIGNLKDQDPSHWISKELEQFLVRKENIYGDTSLTIENFEQWILKVKLLYLTRQILRGIHENDFCQTTNMDVKILTRECLIHMKRLSFSTDSFVSALESIELSSGEEFSKLLKRIVEKQLQAFPPTDSNLRWLFDLKLVDLVGEYPEHWLYNELVRLSDTTLKDTVVLHSVDFYTNELKKLHQEIDFIFISYCRKLIVCVEDKHTLSSTKCFDQLKKFHCLIEKGLGDVMGNG